MKSERVQLFMLCAKLVMQCTIATAGIAFVACACAVAILRPQSPQLDIFYGVAIFTVWGFIYGLSAAYRLFITSDGICGGGPRVVEMLIYSILFTGVVLLNLWYLIDIITRSK